MEHQKYALIAIPRVNRTQANRERALFLLNGYYSDLYGREIRLETVRSLRDKLNQIEATMILVRRSLPFVYKAMARQCVDFERIMTLIEVLN